MLGQGGTYSSTSLVMYKTHRPTWATNASWRPLPVWLNFLFTNNHNTCTQIVYIFVLCSCIMFGFWFWSLILTCTMFFLSQWYFCALADYSIKVKKHQQTWRELTAPQRCPDQWSRLRPTYGAPFPYKDIITKTRCWSAVTRGEQIHQLRQ